MGTTYSVKVIDEVDADTLAEQIEQRLQHVNQLMSTYIKDSEISRLNQLAIGDSMDLSDENLEMLQLSERLHVESEGKFDVTLGPLISLWGFGADPSRLNVPPVADIEAALAELGTDKLQLQGEKVTKVNKVSVDFSAIAKGYGVDEVARVLEAAGANNYLVEIGGELRAKGVNQRGQTWSIGIETPDVQQRVPFTAVPLKDRGMATSGDYRNYFEVNGKRYSHTLDPETGFPITHNLASVTVIAKSAAEADGYATAINVMGAEKGMALAEALNLPVLFIMKEDDGFVMQTSRSFDTYLAENRS